MRYFRRAKRHHIRNRRLRHIPRPARRNQEKPEPMLQSHDNSKSQSPTSFAPLSAAGSPTEQATIGRSLVIKGEVTGAESLYIDGRIEGSINVADHRVTVGRNGNVTANINAREVVIMGKVKGNIQCSDRLDIRGEGVLAGDVLTQRISVEDGAVLKGSVQVRAAESKVQGQAKPAPEPAKAAMAEAPKAVTVGA
jgi:cytoskeletal protein CcmA (bactofilin family)